MMARLPWSVLSYWPPLFTRYLVEISRTPPRERQGRRPIIFRKLRRIPMRYFTGIVVCALLGAVACQSPVPNPIYEAKPLLKLVNSTSNGKLFDVATDDVRLKVLHVFGSAQDMGRAQGELLGSFAYDFLTKAIPEFYRDEVSQIPLGSLPAWLQKLIIGAGKAAAPTVFGAALDYVLAREKKYVAASRSAPLDEMSGLAAGLCSSG